MTLIGPERPMQSYRVRIQNLDSGDVVRIRVMADSPGSAQVVALWAMFHHRHEWRCATAWPAVALRERRAA
jgi:hypothetical protein